MTPESLWRNKCVVMHVTYKTLHRFSTMHDSPPPALQLRKFRLRYVSKPNKSCHNRIFNINPEYSMMHICCKFGDSSSNPLKFMARTIQIFKNSKSKWPKLPWRSRLMTSIFNTSREYPRMPVFCAEKKKFTDGRKDKRSDGQTARRTQRQ